MKLFLNEAFINPVELDSQAFLVLKHGRYYIHPVISNAVCISYMYKSSIRSFGEKKAILGKLFFFPLNPKCLNAPWLACFSAFLVLLLCFLFFPQTPVLLSISFLFSHLISSLSYSLLQQTPCAFLY